MGTITYFGYINIDKQNKKRYENTNGNYYSISSGYYIPIDYREIGNLSAIDRRWKIASINTPNSIFYTNR